MSLTAKDVAEITRLLEASNFDELYLEVDGLKLSLRRGGGAHAAPDMASVSTLSPAAAPAPTAAGDPNVLDIPAPLLGTFYRSPKPGAPPFVEIGSQVAADTIVGIIEVMKLMNTVRAGVQGTVLQIPCRDGALVEYGEVLMRVRKTQQS